MGWGLNEFLHRQKQRSLRPEYLKLLRKIAHLFVFFRPAHGFFVYALDNELKLINLSRFGISFLAANFTINDKCSFCGTDMG